jgi:RNA polymerase sigma factor (sigma-70 family)
MMAVADDPTTIFEAQRPRLARLAYRMIGSFGEADDIVQSAWLRWHAADRAAVAAPAAYLSRIVTRLCLDHMKSARVRRESYYGSWLPEPLIEAAGSYEQDDGSAEADELGMTLMLALERLSPLERAAFLLHDIFGVSLDEVAGTLDREPAAVRQLAVRARRHVRDSRSRFTVDRVEGDRIALAFFEASRSGDLAALRTMLADDVVIRSDGGGKVFAFPRPIVGLDRVLRLFAGLTHKYGAAAFRMVAPMRIDGQPGYASLEHGRLLQTTVLSIDGDGRIAAIYMTRNPDKLAHVARRLGIAGVA